MFSRSSRIRTSSTLFAVILLLSIAMASSAKAAVAPCPGAGGAPILSVIAGMCWECLLPVSIGPVQIGSNWAYPDSTNPGFTFACSCGVPPLGYVGIEFGWWEPGYLVDVVRQRGCAIGLGGVKIDLDALTTAITPGAGAVGAGVGVLFYELKKFGVHQPNAGPGESEMKDGFYNVHMYNNYVASWLQKTMDTACLQASSYTTYFSEIDIGWNDDTIAALFAPDSLLYGNIFAQMACAADCVTATLNTSIDILTWCAGCQGSIFPLSGRVPNQVGGVQASILLLERMLYKTARLSILRATHAHFGQAGVFNGYCVQSSDIMLHKQHYRYQTYWPVPGTFMPHIGGCCYPFGRTTQFMEMMREFPSLGEDWLHGIWQKRHCCLL